MQTSRISERLEAAILEQVFSDEELESRVRGLLRWKIRFNAVDVTVVSGHVVLSGGVISVLDRETAEHANCGASSVSLTASPPSHASGQGSANAKVLGHSVCFLPLALRGRTLRG